MAKRKPKDKDRKNNPNPQWEGFKNFVKMATVPKEELTEKLAEEKRAG